MKTTKSFLIQTALALFCAVVGSTNLQAGLVLINDDFSSNSVEQSTRFNNSDIDSGNWIKRDADWSVTGNALVNPGDAVDDERGAHLINSVTSSDTTLTQITVSFDYSVGAGTTLYFSSSLFTGTVATGMQARITLTGGGWYAGDFNDGGDSSGPGFTGPDYNLKDGTSPAGTTAAALASFAGVTSGTFSQTYDISGFGGGSFSIADVSHVMAVFTSDNDTTGGAISIDNFNVTAIPEPSSLGLFGLAMAGLAVRRRS